jgi:hypothetical protein
MLAAAKIPPVSDSKSAKVREYLDVLLAYKKRFPQATDADLLGLLNTAGVSVKIDTLRKVLADAKKKPRKVRSRKQSGPKADNPGADKAADPPASPDPDAQPPAENSPPAETEQTTKPSSPKSEWLTNEDMTDL